MRFSFACVSLICVSLLIGSGCGKSEWREPFPDRLIIGITDSIGSESGDTAFVLGSIADAVFSPAGNIYLLDQAACCIRTYSPEGDFLQTFTRRGSGPGELLFPTDIAVLESGTVIVRDAGRLALIVLDENGESVEDFVGWSLVFPPEAIVPVDTGHIAGYESNMVADGSDYLFVLKPALYSLNDGTRDVEFLQDSILVTIEGMGSSLNGLQGISAMAADKNNRIFYARSSIDSYEVCCCDISGQTLFTYSMDLPPSEKTVQEIQEETEYAGIRLAAMGGTLPEGFAPEPFHYLVEDIGVDDKGNLWIQRGTESKPVFDVVDSSGQHIASVEYPRHGRFWRFSITPCGSLAWNLNPQTGVQKLYILDLPEIGQDELQ